MPEHMQEYSESIFTNLTRGEMVQLVSLSLIVAYLIFNFTKKK